MLLGVWIYLDYEVFLYNYLGLKVVRSMRIAMVTWICSVIRVFKFVGFVCVFKAIRVIITLNEYANECEAPSECQGR